MQTIKTKSFMLAMKELKALAGKQRRPNLCSALLKNGRLSATNLEVEVSIDVGAIGEGAFLIPTGISFDGLTGEYIDIALHESDANLLTVRTETGTQAIPNFEIADYPDRLIYEGSVMTDMDAKDLRAALDKVIPFASQEVSRYALCGVCFARKYGALDIVATNGHALARVSTKNLVNADFDSGILPLSAAKMLARLLKKSKGNVHISFTSRAFVFETTGFTLSTKMLEGVFPKYEQVIPDAKEINAEILVDVPEVCKVLTSFKRLEKTQFNAVDILAEGNKLKISHEEEGGGDTTFFLTCHCSHMSQVAFAVNPTLLKAALGVLDGKEATISWIDENRPITVKERGLTLVVMSIGNTTKKKEEKT